MLHLLNLIQLYMSGRYSLGSDVPPISPDVSAWLLCDCSSSSTNGTYLEKTRSLHILHGVVITHKFNCSTRSNCSTGCLCWEVIRMFHLIHHLCLGEIGMFHNFHLFYFSSIPPCVHVLRFSSSTCFDGCLYLGESTMSHFLELFYRLCISGRQSHVPPVPTDLYVCQRCACSTVPLAWLDL